MENASQACFFFMFSFLCLTPNLGNKQALSFARKRAGQRMIACEHRRMILAETAEEDEARQSRRRRRHKIS